jgi:hypothetical protein
MNHKIFAPLEDDWKNQVDQYIYHEFTVGLPKLFTCLFIASLIF